MKAHLAEEYLYALYEVSDVSEEYNVFEIDVA